MIPRKHPGPDAVRALREGRGWTHEQMAEAAAASPLEVAAWEAGTVHVPPAQGRLLRELAAMDRRRAAGRAPGPRRSAMAACRCTGLVAEAGRQQRTSALPGANCAGIPSETLAQFASGVVTARAP